MYKNLKNKKHQNKYADDLKEEKEFLRKIKININDQN